MFHGNFFIQKCNSVLSFSPDLVDERLSRTRLLVHYKQ